MAILFMTKTAEKPYPLGLHMPIYPIQGVSPGGFSYEKYEN